MDDEDGDEEDVDELLDASFPLCLDMYLGGDKALMNRSLCAFLFANTIFFFTGKSSLSE